MNGGQTRESDGKKTIPIRDNFRRGECAKIPEHFSERKYNYPAKGAKKRYKKHGGKAKARRRETH